MSLPVWLPSPVFPPGEVSVPGSMFLWGSPSRRGSPYGGLCERRFYEGVSVKADRHPVVLTSSGGH